MLADERRARLDAQNLRLRNALLSKKARRKLKEESAAVSAELVAFENSSASWFGSKK